MASTSRVLGKRGRDKGYEGGPDEFSVRGEVRRQLTQDVTAGDVLGPPNGRAQLMAADGSASQKIGQTQNLAKRVRLEPPFRGMPGAAKINQMAVLNPATSSNMRKPPTPSPTYFQNDGERTMGWRVNDFITVGINCLLVAKNRALTTKALGQYQAMFIHRPDPNDREVHRDTIRDAQMVSVSILNYLLYHSTDSDAVVKYGKTGSLSELREFWERWGVLSHLAFMSGDPERNNNQPTAVNIHKGFGKCLNYWAGCVPQVRNGAILWFVWCQRPKDERLANMYRDMLNAIQAIDYCPEAEQVREEVEKLIDGVLAFEEKHRGEAWFWCLEPAVTYSMATPNSILFNHGRGHPIRYARMHEGAAEMSSPEKYLVNQHRLLHVTAASLDQFDQAVQAAPTCKIDLFG
jgi:hypothetical protein